MTKTYKTFRPVLDRRIRIFTVALGTTLAFVAPTFLSNLSYAAQLQTRSVALTSSAKGATNVGYTVNFTSTGGAGAVVVEFCSNSPFMNSTCDAPTGMDASSAVGGTGFTDITASANKLIIAGTIGAAANISIPITGITNPTNAVPFYARMITYDTKAHAQAYDSTNIDKPTGSSGSGPHIDEGSAAISITDSINVSAAVLETMTFCVAKNTITANCDLSGNAAPKIQLGKTTGSVIALDPSELSTGTVNTQISTNASNGAIVSLKSTASGCGGLKLAGYPSACNISPAQNTNITAGQAKFGVKTATAAAATGGSGTYQPVAASYYNDTTYALKYVAGDATGVTSPYGDPFLDTGGAPVNNMGMQLTFAASITSSTPAGNYSTDISLIATGKF